MNHFNGIPEFLAVAETGGFTKASKKLGTSTAHISRQVADLERRLGVTLFIRTTRKVSLTQAGLQYQRQCAEIYERLDQVNHEIARENVTLEGPLRISLAGEFAQNQVGPALIDFAQMHPKLTLHLDFNTRFTNFADDGTDFAIRYGKLMDSSLIARKLTKRHLIAAASPSYFKQFGLPLHPKDLSEHNCIIANNDVWYFDEDGEEKGYRVTGNFRTNNPKLLLEACLKGMGIAYLPRSSFKDHLERGNLMPCLEGFSSQDLYSWIVYADKRYLNIRSRLAMDHLISHFASWNE